MKAGRLKTVSSDRWRNIAITLTIPHRLPVLCPIVAPKYRVVPSLAETQGAVNACNPFFSAPKGVAKCWVGLRHGPQFERIVEVVVRCYLQATVHSVIKSVLG
jgi:hypothetical protein